MKDNKSKSFFNFLMLDTKKDVEKDQPRVVSSFFCTLIFVILLMDIVAVLFYFRTIQRIDVMKDHPFTQVIASSIKKSVEEHYSYASKTKELVRS